MSTNNFFRTFNTITPYATGDSAVVEMLYITSGSNINYPSGTPNYHSKLLTADEACSAYDSGSRTEDSFFVTFPSGSLESGSSRVYTDSGLTTQAFPNGGNGWFHISESCGGCTIAFPGQAIRIETGSYVANVINCTAYMYNTASISKRVSTSTLACAETVTSHSVFYQGSLTASATNILNATYLYTKSAGTLVQFNNSITGIGSDPGYLKVFSTSEIPENQYGGNNHAMYWNLVNGTATVTAFTVCGNGATKVPSSTNQVFSAVCSQNMGTFIFSSTGQYPGVSSVVYSSSLSSGAYALPGYYKISGSALDFYWIKVVSNGVVHSTGTCGPTP